MKKDKLIKGIALNNEVRFFLVNSTNSVSKAQILHNVYPTAIAGLGRVMTQNILMASMLKEKGDISIKVDGNGVISPILTYCDSDLNIRGYCNNPCTHYSLNEFNKLDVKRAVGENGFISVAYNIGNNNFFTSNSEIISGELAEDFAYFYTQSEQIPTSVSLGVFVDVDNNVKYAGGFIIQLLPFASEKNIAYLEEKLKNIKPITTLLKENKSLEDIAKIIFDDDFKILDEKEVNFYCNCSKERFANSLITLGKNELNQMIYENKDIETICHFCNMKYIFSQNDLIDIYNLI